MRKRLLLSLALLCAVSVWAAQRSSEEAFRVACSFLKNMPQRVPLAMSDW